MTTERPNHLRVVGTSLKATHSRGDLMDALGEVPVEWNFGSPAGEKFLLYCQHLIATGGSIESIAESLGMEDLVAVYNEWESER